MTSTTTAAAAGAGAGAGAAAAQLRDLVMHPVAATRHIVNTTPSSDVPTTTTMAAQKTQPRANTHNPLHSRALLTTSPTTRSKVRSTTSTSVSVKQHKKSVARCLMMTVAVTNCNDVHIALTHSMCV